MKEFMTIIGFGAGLITGALLYKHSQEAKELVNKSEKAVKKEMEMMKEKVGPKLEKGYEKSSWQSVIDFGVKVLKIR